MAGQDSNRSQYVYFVLSIVLVSTLAMMIWVTYIARSNELLQADLEITQSSLDFRKPLSTWCYNNTWRSIGNSSMKHQIYSAYFDGRIEILGKLRNEDSQVAIGSIRIFTVLPLEFKEEVSCILRYEDFPLSEIKADVAKPLSEHHDKNFSAFTIACPLYRDQDNLTVYLPQAVAIRYESNSLSHLSPTFVPISYPRNMDQQFAKPKPMLSICVGPLRHNYSDVLRMVEFVEMYRILGATHFYFYNMDSSANVQLLLNHYRNQGLADILDWNLQDYKHVLHYGGIMAQVNDCVYRAYVVDNYRYAAMVDLDEIIMPLEHYNLLDFLTETDVIFTSAFVFESATFPRKEIEDKFSVPDKAVNRVLYTQTKIQRNSDIMPAYMCSKCIVNTHFIVEMGVQQVWRATPGNLNTVVDSAVGLLFHYHDKCVNFGEEVTTDFTARKYGSLIWERVDDTCLNVFPQDKGVCPSMS